MSMICDNALGVDRFLYDYLPFSDAFDHIFDIMVENLTDVYLRAKVRDDNLLRSVSHCEENISE